MNRQETPRGPRVLVVEDETAMRIALEDCLRGAGFRVILSSDGESGLVRAIEEKPELVILDVMMPKLDGFAVCAEFRRLCSRSAILMLTARGQWEDRVQGLDLGADDYLVKPFRTEELLARIRALLRRQERKVGGPLQIKVGDTEIDLARQIAVRKGRALHLTSKEFALLRLLVDARGEPVPRERFLDVVWGYAAFPTTRTVDNHVANLRAKLEPDPALPRWIKTVHGIGYRLEIPNS